MRPYQSNNRYLNKNWNTVFMLDELSPSGISWGQDQCNKNGKVTKTRAGSYAGFPTFRSKKDGGSFICFRVCVDGIFYIVHRIIYIMKYGNLSELLYVDHIDGNPANNKLENLRAVSHKTNMQNKKVYSGNNSGMHGVNRIHRKGAEGLLYYWAAIWKDINGVQKQVSYSIDKLGEDTAKTLAIEKRKEEIGNLVKSGDGYTNRHTGSK